MVEIEEVIIVVKRAKLKLLIGDLLNVGDNYADQIDRFLEIKISELRSQAQALNIISYSDNIREFGLALSKETKKVWTEKLCDRMGNLNIGVITKLATLEGTVTFCEDDRLPFGEIYLFVDQK